MDPVHTINTLALAALITYSSWVLPTPKLRWLFGLMLLLMGSYELFDVPDVAILIWLRHTPLYIGELFFYFFMFQFGRKYIEIDAQSPAQPPRPIRAMPVLAVSTASWFDYVTAQGLPHIFTLPLFFLLYSLVRFRFALYDSPYRVYANWLTAAAAVWIFIHVTEFLLESQKVMTPSINGQVERIEIVLFYLGLVLFAGTLMRLKVKLHAN